MGTKYKLVYDIKQFTSIFLKIILPLISEAIYRLFY